MKANPNHQPVYITTPIYYTNGEPHLGHAYTTVVADVFARYYRAQNHPVFFATGTDEHGQKIAKAAAEQQIDPLTYVANNAQKFNHLWQQLKISYDRFVQTTQPQHIATVQTVFNQLVANKMIKSGTYEGWYCETCEEFLLPDQIHTENNKKMCFQGHTTLKQLSETAYYLLAHLKQEWLTNYYQDHPNWFIPATRSKELLNTFLLPGLTDLCITRSTVTWGIPVPGIHENLTIYVWFDALINYLTALNYNQPTSLMNQFWADNTLILQIMGKEITRFHGIYWPLILKSLDLRLPDVLLAHGWIMIDDQKMSKSSHNGINPEQLIKRYSADHLRFFLIHDLDLTRDSKYSPELFIKSINANLVNNIGNLFARVTKMISTYNPSYERLDQSLEPEDKAFAQTITNDLKQYHQAMTAHRPDLALTTAVMFADKINKYIEQRAPWQLAKDPARNKNLNAVLFNLHWALAVLTQTLAPVLVQQAPKMAAMLGIKPDFSDANQVTAGLGLNPQMIKVEPPLFKRLNITEELAYWTKS